MIEVLQAAIEKYGAEAQVVVALEEMAELQQALTKFLRGNPDQKNINEEMADVSIMLEQLKLIFNNRAAVTHWEHKKLTRLESRLKSSSATNSTG